ncbi:MAG: hypothetical protein NDJ89_10590 [Oligoflexia bacterium]|nr:hypothetical protein [Oligoflexia bacterium]
MSPSGEKNRKTLLVLAALVGLPVLLLAIRFSLMRSAPKQEATETAQAPSSSQQSPASEQAEKTQSGNVSGDSSTKPQDSSSSQTALESSASPAQTQAPMQAQPPQPPRTSQQAAAPAVPQIVEPQGCVTLAFKHKKATGHTDEESCSQHKNLIRLPHANPTSVCVRVNKTPVRFQTVAGKPNEILLGAIAGPKSEITAQYCFGKASCADLKKDCVIPKDEFMDAIGASDDKLAQAGRWDAEGAGKDADVNAHLDAEMKRELDNLDRQVRGENGVFSDWIAGTPAISCEGKKDLLAKTTGKGAEKGAQ